MKLLKKKGVAITIMIAAILLSSLYGLSKRPQVEVPKGGEALNESLSTAAFAPYLVDQADVLSSSQEETINLYNANWDSMVGSILSVVTVDTVTGDMEDAAYGWADSLELGSNDAILLMAVGSGDYTVVASGAFYDRLAAHSTGFVDSAMAEYVNAGDYGGAALSLFGQLHVLISQEATYAPSAGGVAALSIVPIVVLLVVLVAIFSAMDSIRYSAWHARYGSHGGPAGSVPAHPLVAPARQRLVPPPEKSPAPQRSQAAPRPRRLWRGTSSSHGRRTPTAQERQLRRRPGRKLRRKPGREFWRRPRRQLWRRPQRRLRWEPGRKLWRRPQRRLWRWRPRRRLRRPALSCISLREPPASPVGCRGLC